MCHCKDRTPSDVPHPSSASSCCKCQESSPSLPSAVLPSWPAGAPAGEKLLQMAERQSSRTMLFLPCVIRAGTYVTWSGGTAASQGRLCLGNTTLQLFWGSAVGHDDSWWPPELREEICSSTNPKSTSL